MCSSCETPDAAPEARARSSAKSINPREGVKRLCRAALRVDNVWTMPVSPETRSPHAQLCETPNGSGQPNLPRWDGSDPAGRSILVACDSSLDECILLARYLPLLAGRRARVIVACPMPLSRLLGQMPGVEVASTGSTLREADVLVSIGALPRLFGTTPATIPTFGAYFRPPTALLDSWRQRIRPMRDAGQRVVGISLTACSDNWREALLRAPETHFIELDDLELNDAAAAISMLDLAIATESSVAHLAGALGKPARVLARFSPDWCWQASGDDTPWYPSVRLFRQPSPGDWASPLREVVEFLNPRTARFASRSAAA
jgi:hypothetical protein